jgi:hypothetical protein
MAERLWLVATIRAPDYIVNANDGLHQHTAPCAIALRRWSAIGGAADQRSRGPAALLVADAVTAVAARLIEWFESLARYRVASLGFCTGRCRTHRRGRLARLLVASA